MADAKSIVVLGIHIRDDMLELAIHKGEKWAYPEYFAMKALVPEDVTYLEKKGYEAAKQSARALAGLTIKPSLDISIVRFVSSI